MSYNLSLQTNNAEIQELISIVNALPDAGGVELPDLINPGNAGTLLDGYELIDQEGKVVAGTIPIRTDLDITVSEEVITAPAGYYKNGITQSVDTTIQAIPSISIDANGKITASATQGSGYVIGGTQSTTKQLPTQAAKTVSPSTSSQTVVESGVYTTGAITVSAMPVAEQATPTITVSSSGLITAATSQNSGYVEAGTKTKTQQLTTQATKTITPTKSEQTAVSSGVYTTGAIKVAPIPDKYIDSSDATSDVNEVFLGETFYANGEKKVGTFTIESELSEQDELLAELEEILNNKSAAGGEANPVLQSKTVSPTTSSQTVTADSGYDGLSDVTVNAIPSEYIVPSGTLPITENGTYDVKNYESTIVNVASSGGGSDGNTDFEDRFLTNDMSVYANDRVTTIKDYAFYNCSKLTTANFINVATLGSNVFNGCTSLTSTNMPQLTKIGNNAFASCKSLATINFPLVTSIGGYAFYNCFALTNVNFPQTKSIGGFAFGYCTSLATADFSQNVVIPANTFANCRKLSQLTLAASSLCTLANSNAFTSTPYAGYKNQFSGTPYIYVPASLVSTYQSATNWTYFSSYFSGI